jgi:hypothetical protein
VGLGRIELVTQSGHVTEPCTGDARLCACVVFRDVVVGDMVLGVLHALADMPHCDGHMADGLGSWPWMGRV